MKAIDVERYKILSGSALKLIACVSMLSDHLARWYLTKFSWAQTVWFTVAGKSLSLVDFMTLFGRFAFPIFAFLLVEGFVNTRNRKRYGLSLLILALLSEIPFNLMHGGTLWFPRQNVMFTLLLGYLAMWSVEFFKSRPVVSMFLLLLMFLVSRFMLADYQTSGFIFILLMYGLRKENVIRCVASIVVLPAKAMVFLSLILTCLYNGKRGFVKTPFLKYCFYAFYPVHMLIIYFMAR